MPKDWHFQKMIEQMSRFPNQTIFPINKIVSLITPSSEIKVRLALANMMFNSNLKVVDDFRNSRSTSRKFTAQ